MMKGYKNLNDSDSLLWIYMHYPSGFWPRLNEADAGFMTCGQGFSLRMLCIINNPLITYVAIIKDYHTDHPSTGVTIHSPILGPRVIAFWMLGAACLGSTSQRCIAGSKRSKTFSTVSPKRPATANINWGWLACLAVKMENPWGAPLCPAVKNVSENPSSTDINQTICSSRCTTRPWCWHRWQNLPLLERISMLECCASCSWLN